MFTEALFAIASDWKEPKCSSPRESISQFVVFPQNGILISNKNDINTHICNHMNEFPKHYDKKPSTKEIVLHESVL